MQTNPKATYGEVMIRAALEQGAVETLLLSEALTNRRVEWSCKKCKKVWNATQNSRSDIPNCPTCDSEDVVDIPENTMDLIDELTLLAERTSSKVSLISLDTEEGATLNAAFGGIAAILRYPWS
jgi:peptide chain release factor subunit 1